MWGNRLGWSISALLVLVTAGLVHLLLKLDRPTPPTELSLNSVNLDRLNLTFPAIQGHATTSPSDATKLIERAILLFTEDALKYQRFADDGRFAKEIDPLNALMPMIEAMKSPDPRVFLQSPELLVNFESEHRELEALRVLGQCLNRASLVLSGENNARASEMARAAFVLGSRLVEERLTHAELSVGLQLLAEAAPLLGKLDPARASELTEFDATRREFSVQRVKPIWTAIGSIDNPTIARHAGDVFVFAIQSRERMWRVEAVFALGRSQFNSATPGDRVHAVRALKRLSETEADPIVRLAAQQSRDLTIEQYRMLR